MPESEHHWQPSFLEGLHNPILAGDLARERRLLAALWPRPPEWTDFSAFSSAHPQNWLPAPVSLRIVKSAETACASGRNLRKY
jgi:hypothetical protein